MASKKLYRSRTNRIIAGVCGGIAEYFETDPVLVRIIFAILSFIGAGGIILYIALWALVPERPMRENDNEAVQPNTGSNGHSNDHASHDSKMNQAFVNEVLGHMQSSHNRSHGILGFFLILIGIIFLVDNFYPGFGLEKFWPLFLIFFGLLIMTRKHN